jgi:hypothetical protein
VQASQDTFTRILRIFDYTTECIIRQTIFSNVRSYSEFCEKLPLSQGYARSAKWDSGSYLVWLLLRDLFELGYSGLLGRCILLGLIWAMRALARARTSPKVGAVAFLVAVFAIVTKIPRDRTNEVLGKQCGQCRHIRNVARGFKFVPILWSYSPPWALRDTTTVLYVTHAIAMA